MSIMFIVAAVIRLYNIQRPFVGLLPVREFRSAMIARDFYFTHNPEVPAWQQEVAHTSRQREWSLEPPILEMLAAVSYRLMGQEALWIPRLYATLFWLIGSFFFWQIARSLFGDETAVFLTAYYLFVPIGVIASKSFQPDTLMMMFYLAALWAILRYDEKPVGRRLLWIMSAAGLAVFVRPLSIFAIFAAFTMLMIYRFRTGNSRPWFHFILFNIALLLGLAYYGYGLMITDSLAGQADITFQPHLLLYREFWKGWIYTGLDAATFAAFIAALLGLALLNSPRLQWLLVGLGSSYFFFGLLFNYHISTHNYYHLQLIPTLALSAGPFIAFLLTSIHGLNGSWARQVWLGGLLTFFVLLALRQVVQQGYEVPRFENEAVAQEIGELVHHSTQTVYLSPYYGRPLEYFGQLSGSYWPRAISYELYRRPDERPLTISERLANLSFTPDYFIITDFREYGNHHDDLKAYLQTCPLVDQTDSYLIYEYCKNDLAEK
jgi:4-amino-4-deoxy-L-arabinose transferase-like glycosyltransferase